MGKDLEVKWEPRRTVDFSAAPSAFHGVQEIPSATSPLSKRRSLLRRFIAWLTRKQEVRCRAMK